MQNLLGSCFLL